jgi:hypothetical protein
MLRVRTSAVAMPRPKTTVILVESDQVLQELLVVGTLDRGFLSA